VRPSDVELWLNDATSGLKKSTRNEYLCFIKQTFDQAVRDGVITKSPADHISPSKRNAVDRSSPDRSEFQKIVRHVRSGRGKRSNNDSADFIEFLGLSGLGNGEAAQLRRRDVDMVKNVIRVRRLKTDTYFQIPIFPQLRPLLQKLLSAAPPSPSSKLLKVRSVKKSLSSAAKKLDLSHTTHRSLRRMFVTDAIERGVDVKTLAGWQGHQDGGKLILDTYSHVRRPHDEAMAKLLT